MTLKCETALLALLFIAANGGCTTIMSDQQENVPSSVVMAASAILQIVVVDVTFFPWTPEPTPGLQQREALMHLRLAEVMKGRLRQKAGETFELRVQQHGTSSSRVMDFYGVWSHAKLSEGASFVAFCRGASDDAGVLLDEEHMKEISPSDQVYSDTKAAVELERNGPAPGGALAAADAGKARYGAVFAQFLWEYVRTDVVRNLPAFSFLMEIVENPETTTAARNTYLTGAYEELGLRSRPLRGQEIRLAQAMFRIYDLPDEANLKKNIAEVYLPNLLGLANGKAKYSSVEVFSGSAADRMQTAALLSQASQDAHARAVVKWLRE